MFDADVLYLTRWELSYSPRDVGMAAETKSCCHPVLYSYKKKKCPKMANGSLVSL